MFPPEAETPQEAAPDMIASEQPTTGEPIIERPHLVWEETPCPLCAAKQSTPLLEAPDPTPETGGLWFAVVQCPRCGLCYTNPRPDPATIGNFYPKGYLPHKKRGRNRLRRWYPLAAINGKPCPERRALPWHGLGRLLDFGCGGGTFLERMSAQGWQVVGMDSSETAVEEVRTKLSLPAVLGTLPHPELLPGSFDVITMWHSLEHVHAPMKVLRAAYELLVPGGRLFVAVPNLESKPFRWFGSSWFGLDLPRHLTHFAPATLKAMLECAGFRVANLRVLRHDDWLRSSARLAIKRKELRSRLLGLLRFKLPARFAAWLCWLTGSSDAMLAVAERPL